jgi:hypothetical protein
LSPAKLATDASGSREQGLCGFGPFPAEPRPFPFNPAPDRPPGSDEGTDSSSGRPTGRRGTFDPQALRLGRRLAEEAWAAGVRVQELIRELTGAQTRAAAPKERSARPQARSVCPARRPQADAPSRCDPHAHGL